MARTAVALTIVLMLVVTSGTGQSVTQNKDSGCPEPSTIVDSKFKPGQVWQYKTRQGEDGSTVTVLRTETLAKGGTVIHVRVDGIRLKNCTGGPEPNLIGHAPFAKDALDRSVTKLLRTGEVPDYAEGYEDWRSHCGGVYTITVKEMLDVDQTTFTKGVACR
jgi:hypothetical protein